MTATICTGATFSVTPTNIVNGIIPSGTTYTWGAPAGTGFTGGLAQAVGVGAISGTLFNANSSAVTAVYTVTPTTVDCGVGSVFTVTVIINPVAAINTMTVVSCSGTLFSITPTNIVNGVVPAGTTYGWSVPSVTGGITGGASLTGTTNIRGTLVNPTNTTQTATYIVTPVSGLCVGNTFTVIVTLNPIATIVPMTTVSCSGVAFTITPTDPVHGIIPAGTTYTWNAPTGVGITGGVTGVAASADINGSLTNITSSAKTATYLVTPLSGNCTGAAFTLTVTVNAIATITSITTTICTGASFNITPTDGVNGIIPAGTTYTWGAPTGTGFTGGVSGTSGSSITGTLFNTNSFAVTATYTITPSTGCGEQSAFTLMVTINPVAVISPLSTTTCTGVTFSITPTDLTDGVVPAGTTYTWTAPTGTGFTGGLTQVTPVTVISGTLASTTNIARTATYIITPTSGVCVGAPFSVTVNLNPGAIMTPISATTCSGVLFSLTPVDGINGVIPAGTLYSWSAPAVTGGLTGGMTVTNAATFTGTLSNPTNIAQTATYLITPLSGSCIGTVFSITVSVTPVATITPMTTVACGGVVFSITPVNLTNGIVPAGTTYVWSAPTGTGFTGGVTQVSSVSNISGILANTTNVAVPVTYLVTPTAGSCTGAQFSLTVTLNPRAIISPMSTTTCSGVTFSVTPTEAVDGIVPVATTYTWGTPTGVGITGGTSSTGTPSSIFGTLNNTTNIARTATYIVTPVTGSCTGNPFSVTVTVNPIAVITLMTSTTCSGTMFSVTPVNVINGIVPSGTTYSWAAPTVTGGITGGISSTGNGNITGILVNPTHIQQTATYIVTPTTVNCGTGSTFTVTVTVNPLASITPMTAVTCAGVLFRLTPTNNIDGIVPAGTTYTWGAPTGSGFTGGLTQAVAASSISGTLANTTTAAATATYLVTPLTGSCIGPVFSVTVSLSPRAVITPMTTTVCSGISFVATPTDGSNGIIPSGTVYTWSVPTGTGITGGASQAIGVTVVTGTLNNITSIARTATYLVTPVSGNCAGAVFSVTVTVSPIGIITDMTAVTCNGVTFSVTPTNITNGVVPAGTTYTWSEPTGTGFTGGLSQSVGFPSIFGNLISSTSVPVTATYLVTPTTGACTGFAFTVSVTLNPGATITPMSTTICSGGTFSVTPTNGIDGVVPNGTVYTWGAPTGVGFSGGLTQATGSTNIFGTLTNLTNAAVTATYIVTPTPGNCAVGNAFSVTVTINAATTITPITAVTCSGVGFTITPVSGINGIIPAGTTYTWAVPTGGGFSNGLSNSTGSVNINGILTNTTNTAQTATYIVTPFTANCGTGNTFTVTVSLNPAATIAPMTSVTCSGLTFTVTPTQTINGIVPAGTTYGWGAPSGAGFTGGLTQTGIANINGTLVSTTNVAQTATYLVTPTSGNCTGALFSVTVSLNPVATINAMTAVTCSGILFSVTPVNGTNGILPTGTTYSWATPSVTGGLTGGLSATNAAFINGTLTNPTNTTQTATYILTPLSGNCTGVTFTVTVTVNPVVIISTMTATGCSGVAFAISPTDIVNGIVPAGTTYTWAVPSMSAGLTGGVSATGASSINGTLVNATNAALTATYFVTPATASCGTGNVFSITLTINPVASITAMTAITCTGVTFTLTPTNLTNGIVPSGTLYAWSAPSVTGGVTGGLSASGQANISGTLTNPTNISQTVTYQVTPSTVSCGSGNTFTVTVVLNPGASVTAMTAVVCSGAAFSLTPTNLTNGIVPSGTLYAWSAPSVTGGITGGAAGISSTNVYGQLTNPLNSTQTATYLVTPTTVNCGPGPVFTVTVTINSGAIIGAMTATTCSGVLFAITPTDIVNGIVPAGTTYTWSVPTGAGLTGGTSQTIASSNIYGTLTNTLNVARTATYIVTPFSTNCGSGIPFTLVVTVNPVATIAPMTGTICSGVTFNITPVNGTNGIVPTGTLYTWSAPTGSGFLNGVSETVGSLNLNGNLTSTTSSAVTATYLVTPTAGNCVGSVFSLTILLNPGATITPMTVTTCSGVGFVVTPTNGVNGVIPNGTLYSWTTPTGTGFTGGVSQPSNVSNISGTLINTGNFAVTATYVVTPTPGTCGSSASFTLTVTVNPTASINPLSATTCAGVAFTITPTQGTDGIVPVGTTYTWNAPTGIGFTGGVTRVAPSTNINGLLDNTTNITRTATYTVTPLSGACTGAVFTVTITLNPAAHMTAMTGTVCSGVTFTLTPVNGANGIVPAGTTYTWAAPTGSSFTGGLSQATGVPAITGTLNATVNSVVTATYIVTPTTVNCGAGTTFTVVVTINPAAFVNPMTVITCSGVAFTITPTNIVNGIIPAGTTFTWSAPSVTGGITGGSGLTATTNVRGTLTNPTNIQQTATYLVTPNTPSCGSGAVFSVTVSVYPVASITAITGTSCSGTPFAVTPVNGVNGIVPSGTTYTWTAPTGTGFTGGASQVSGISPFTATLINTTSSAVTATYILTPTAGSCTGLTFVITLTVNPVASINAMTATTCSGVAFSATPTDFTNGIVPAGTTYTWTAPTGNGFTGGQAQVLNVNNLFGTLVNTTSSSVTATYIVTPTTVNCSANASFTLVVTVNPGSTIYAMTAVSCSGISFSVTPTDGINGIIPAGTTYSWLAPSVTGG